MATGRKILVIADDGDFRSPVRTLLESEGHEVLEARSGGEGLRRLSEGQPDLIRPDRYLTKPLDIPLFLEVVARAPRRGAAAGQ